MGYYLNRKGYDLLQTNNFHYSWRGIIQKQYFHYYSKHKLIRIDLLDQFDAKYGRKVEQNLKFQGQYLDREAGSDYNAHRYYDPQIGRFTQPVKTGTAKIDDLKQ